MKIAVNLRLLNPGKIGGMEGYVRNLLKYLLQVDPTLELLLFVTDENEQSFDFNPHRVNKFKLSHTEYCREIPIALRDNGIDVYFCPLLAIEPFTISVPSVVTIPDVQHEFFPEFFSSDILCWRRLNYKSSVSVADAVLTLSQYSARTIIEKLGVPGDKVFPILLSADDSYTAEFHSETDRHVRNKYKLPDAYGFFPANTWPHKNHPILLKALGICRKNNLTIKIVLTGAPDIGHQSLEKAISAEGLQNDILYLGYVPKDDMRYLYKNAAFLVFPSLFEGFGMPVLEAMLSDCPVICSGTTSLPEVAGDAALYFDPNDPYDIAEAMRKVISDQGLRHTLIMKGQIQAKKFEWRYTAKQTLEVFRNVIISYNIRVRNTQLVNDVTSSCNQSQFSDDCMDSVLRKKYLEEDKFQRHGEDRDQQVAGLNAETAKLRTHIVDLSQQIDALNAQQERILSSNSWMLTKPFRLIRQFLSRCKPGTR